jgi:major membrane immunogen (membrane-anchored lipoprotein)
MNCYSLGMKKRLIATALISAFLLTGCGNKDEGDGLACDWVEIEGVMKEICISDPNS